MARESKNFCEVKEIADLFGVSVRRVQQLTQEGIIKTTQTPNGKRYDKNATVKVYIKYLSDKAYGRDQTKKESDLKAEKMAAEIELKNTQNEMQKLRHDIYSGKYIKVEQVKADYQQFMIILKRLLLSIPSRVAGQLNGLIEPSVVRQIEHEIDSDIKNTMESFVVSGVSDSE